MEEKNEKKRNRGKAAPASVEISDDAVDELMAQQDAAAEDAAKKTKRAAAIEASASASVMDSETESEEEMPQKKKKKKRLSDLKPSAHLIAAASSETKAERRKRKLQAKLLRKKQKLNQPLKEESTTIRLKSADEKATFLLAQITASASLSKLECEEYKLATSHFEVFAKADATDRLEQASATVKKFTKNQGKGKAKGSPRILVVCGGALRAVDVARAFVPLQCGVSKLFAKHIKEAEQAEYLRESTALVAVGTPHRLHRLSALGALKLDQLALLVIDMEPDVKGSTLFDQQQIRENLVAWYREHLHPRILQNNVKIWLM